VPIDGPAGAVIRLVREIQARGRQGASMQTADTGSYPALLQPFNLAGVPLRNRVMHASMSTKMSAGPGVTDALIQYHATRALGGAALIVSEPLGMAPHQREMPRPQVMPTQMDGFRRWADAVESHDCRLLGQIQDAGRGRHYFGRSHDALGASALPDDLSWTVPHALQAGDIQALVAAFAEASYALKSCGFSGVELSAGHGHLFHQFLSPWSNRREDAYGGDWAGRTRFVAEVLAAIRALCGKGFIIGLKLPGEDGVADSIGVTEAAIITERLTGARQADYVSFCQGSHARSLEMHLPDRYGERLPYLDLTRRLRMAAGGTPVVALGRITDPAEAEAILQRGDAELIGLGRALVADPAWLTKASINRVHDLRYCISCNTCWGTITSDHRPIACVNNPRVGRTDEADFWPSAAPVSRRVSVVGAGIAGLEAAWVAAARGHQVTLFGASDELGGRARLRAPLPGGETITSIYDYQHTAAVRAGVTFRLGRRASFEDLMASRPDAVVLACGSDMIPPDWLPSEERDLVGDLRCVMAGLTTVRGRQKGTAVIFDADHSEGTYASAERLQDLFDRVVILTPRDTIAIDMQLVTRQGVLRRMAERRIQIVPLSQPVWTDAFENGALEYRNVYNGDRTIIEDVALLTYATPRRPADDLAEPLRQAGVEVHLVGDCQCAADLLSATATGHEAGNTV
jgi:2,4-dienoyl-CoA reductase-like NADH-dependent reductase (Old Yellow Enzyme family)